MALHRFNAQVIVPRNEFHELHLDLLGQISRRIPRLGKVVENVSKADQSARVALVCLVHQACQNMVMQHAIGHRIGERGRCRSNRFRA